MRNRNRFDKDINHEQMDKKQTLQGIFNEIGNLTDVDYGANDKGGKIHTYLETYDRLFEPFRNGCTFMEIGLAMGDSLKLWDRYFENSVIVGVDISIVFELPTKYKNEVHVIQADATKPEFLEKIKDYEFSIVVDDGGHMEDQQVATFNLLKPFMKKNSIYLVEDILNLDSSRSRFESLHGNCEIFDFRQVNGRFDNVLILYKF